MTIVTARSTIEALEECKRVYEDILVIDTASIKDGVARDQLRKINKLLDEISKERASGQ